MKDSALTKKQLLEEVRRLRREVGRLEKARGTDARDVTERKQAEERIQIALKEKELLLKEIYHRVINNLQIIISLLKLQAGYITDSKAQELFRKSRNRIASMALIHEILYRADNLARVDFNQYIHSLISHLFYGYAIQPGQIRLETDIRDIFLDINTAIPCGLIINELVSSCLDRGFPDHARGIIQISMLRPAGDGIELSFSCRGGGGPKELIDEENPSFGRELIQTLTGQLGGELKIERNEWTTFKITFSDR